MKSHARQEILRLHSYADFHGGFADVVHARLHDEKLADVYRLPEIDSIDGHRDTDVPRVPDCRDRGSGVHHREHNAPEDVAEHVGVLWHHQLGRLVLTLVNGARGFRRSRGGPHRPGFTSLSCSAIGSAHVCRPWGLGGDGRRTLCETCWMLSP